jgi:hypothetical protein
MSEVYDASTEVCGKLEEIRQELDYASCNMHLRRERIATACLAGLLASEDWRGTVARNETGFARDAVAYADGLIRELDKPAETTKQE